MNGCLFYGIHEIALLVQGQPDPLRVFVRPTPPLTLKWISVVCC